MDPICLDCGHRKSDHRTIDMGYSTRGIVCSPMFEGDDLGACSCRAPSYMSTRAQEDVMDPTSALENLRQLIVAVADGEVDDIGEIERQFTDLDTWLSRGGFLPEQWSKNR